MSILDIFVARGQHFDRKRGQVRGEKTCSRCDGAGFGSFQYIYMIHSTNRHTRLVRQRIVRSGSMRETKRAIKRLS